MLKFQAEITDMLVFLHKLLLFLQGALLHLVANVISKLELCKGMLSAWRGKCHSDQMP